MGENDFNRVAESDDKEESCEIFIELSASEIEDKSDKGEPSVLEMNTKLKVPKSNNQFVTLLLLFLMTISSIFTVLQNVYDDKGPVPVLSNVGTANYTVLNDTIKAFILH